MVLQPHHVLPPPILLQPWLQQEQPNGNTHGCGRDPRVQRGVDGAALEFVARGGPVEGLMFLYILQPHVREM